MSKAGGDGRKYDSTSRHGSLYACELSMTALGCALLVARDTAPLGMARMEDGGGRSAGLTKGASGRLASGRQPLPELLISARASVQCESEHTSRRALNQFKTLAYSSSASFEPAEPVP
jgi:hypothetical protein